LHDLRSGHDLADGRTLRLLGDDSCGQAALVGQPLRDDAVIVLLGLGGAEPAEIDFSAVDADPGLA
jgi:hypothetical protein